MFSKVLFFYFAALPFVAPFAGVPISNYSKVYEKLGLHHGHHNTFTSVFIVSTFQNSIEFDKNNGHTDYVEMFKGCRKTWAADIKHFYMLTADSEADRRVVADPQLCQNLTNHYIKEVAHIDPNPREQVYLCKGIRVLHTPYCDLFKNNNDDRFHCCRGDAAMKYHLNKAAVNPNYPKWFYMADDDYYLRVHRFEGIVSHVNPLNPYAVTWGARLWPTGNGKVARRHYDYAFAWYKNCSVPCVHLSAWNGYTFLSLGALRVMETEIRSRGLSYLCREFNVYHDLGIGMYLWQQSIPYIELCCGAGSCNEKCHDEGRRFTYFHLSFF
jgi:hypothetical protein